MVKEIGLIGYGNFGRFITSHLSRYFEVQIFDFLQNGEIFKNSNIKFVDINEVTNKEIIILALPVQYLENSLISIKDIVNKKALVLDVCSVKIKPINLMLKYLPETTEIIGTHPLFGPQSAKDGIENLNIVLTNVRSQKFKSVKNFLKDKLKLNILEETKENHDKKMAMVQGLTHFIAKGLKSVGIYDTPLKTISYDNLLKFYNILENETDDLFYTIQNENPYTKEMRKNFIQKLIDIENSLNVEE